MSRIDTYGSHEGDLYCKPHLKQLLRPKTVEIEEDINPCKFFRTIWKFWCGFTNIINLKPSFKLYRNYLLTVRRLKPRMIISENTPEETPADVVRGMNAMVHFCFIHIFLYYNHCSKWKTWPWPGGALRHQHQVPFPDVPEHWRERRQERRRGWSFKQGPCERKAVSEHSQQISKVKRPWFLHKLFYKY